MTKKTENSMVWRLLALAAIFVLSSTVALASPYRRAFLLPGGSYGWSAQAPLYVGMPQNAVPGSAPNAMTYGAAYAPSVPTNLPYGAADYMSAVTQQGTYRWQTDHLPIKIYIGDGTGTPGYRPEFRQICADAFDTWCQASGNKLAWTQASDPSKADITINWTANVTQRPEGTEAGKTDALTKLNTMTGQGIIYGARMQLLTYLNGKPFSTLEMSKTILHETGHALGLQGHSPNRTDIMYYAINPSQQPALTDRDTNTMSELYQSYPVQDAVALAPHRIK